MPAYYDSFDYPAYWIGREYEHRSEIIALKAFLLRIRKIKTILEVGTGFGRLTPTYIFRARRVILSDPSSKLLKIAKDEFRNHKNIKYLHTSLENLPNKVRHGSCDLLIMIRVIHHIKNLDQAFKNIGRLLKSRGYLIFEFANKRHWKAIFQEFLKGNLTFPFDIFTTDIKTEKGRRQTILPFLNFHPDQIDRMLLNHGFEIIEKRSVSNIRSTFLKRILPVELLVFLDKISQRILSNIDFGPSIFILARKVG